MKWPRRGRGDSQAEGDPNGAAGATDGGRGKGLRRLVRAILLVGVLAAFTRPGRRLTRAAARWLDALRKGGDEGLLTFNDLQFQLGKITNVNN